MDKRGLNLHHVYHSGANRKYYLAVLAYIHNHPEYDISVSRSSLGEFIDVGVPPGTDVLSYQTFPDESNMKKFNPKVVSQSDFRFHKFGGEKIIVDAHDCGDKDAYSRMGSNKILPRVKSYPTAWFLKNYNVILSSTVSANPGIFMDIYTRTIPISCKFGRKEQGFYGHIIRETVETYLRQSFDSMTSFNWVEDKAEYFRELKWTNIVVGAPGWGRYNGSYWGALKSGALLFAHRSLDDIKLLPHSDLIDGEDYVSYDLFNFKIKLQRLLDSPDEVERIRNNGRMKFKEGFDYKKSADQLVNHLKGEIK